VGRLGFGIAPAPLLHAMRDYDEADPKKPQPVRTPKKGSNAFESAEVAPWRPLKDADRDRHRHV